MPRKTPEWIGKTDNTPAPPRVRLRVFDAHKGICGLSGVKILATDKWQLDHKIALINGGENRESNLHSVLVAPHKAKTKKDVAEKAKVNRLRKKHLGIKSSKIGGFKKLNGFKYNWKTGRNERIEE